MRLDVQEVGLVLKRNSHVELNVLHIEDGVDDLLLLRCIEDLDGDTAGVRGCFGHTVTPRIQVRAIAVQNAIASR
ncbi:hypothetical protein [Ralstonia sp. 1138]|uniref:hypothetical protein n=1 Tax=Ralstonia sp. 1138 TaxID=3156423 RepID=UPI003391AF3B